MVFQERPRGDLRCSKCDAKIETDHPYAWCIKCGTSLPENVRAQLPRLQAVKAAGAEAAEARRREHPDRTTELVVEGRVIPCPICGHDRYRTRHSTMGTSRAMAIFNLEWAGSEALNYVCNRCGHVLWFILP